MTGARAAGYKRPVRVRLERIGIVAAMAVAALNIWTGAPLLGLWVGSRLAGDSGLSMLAVLAVVVMMGAACLGLVRVLAVLGATHDRLSGRTRTVRRHVPWLRSMRAERPHAPADGEHALRPLDYVLVAAVVACFVAFEGWFFFFSGSPIDTRSGR